MVLTSKYTQERSMLYLETMELGKSTLIKILSGVHEPTSGSIFIEEQERTFRSPRDASAAGIGTVYQDLAINQLMSVTRNFFMGRELTSRLWISSHG